MVLLLACASAPTTTPTAFDSGDWHPPFSTDTQATGTTVPADSADSDPPTDTSPVDTGRGDTAPADTGPVVWWDCSALPELPTSDTELTAGRAFRDLLFNDDGQLLGFDGTALVGSTYDGTIEVVATLTDAVHGLTWLRDGDIAGAGGIALERIRLGGSMTPIADITSGYAVTEGPDGLLYASNIHDVERVDPDTGVRSVWVTLSGEPRGIVFGLDNHEAFIAAGDGVYEVGLDEALDPVGDPFLFVPLDGIMSDFLSMDACGNLYVAEYGDRSLTRIAPDRTTTTIFADAGNAYGHGAEFGNGVGRWREDALYLAQPYDDDTVRELVLGVPSADLVRPSL